MSSETLPKIKANLDEYIGRVLTMSTSHMPEENAKAEALQELSKITLVANYEEGCFIYVPFGGESYDENDELMPDCVETFSKTSGHDWRFLIPIFSLAREKRCTFVRFDRDYPEIEGLQTWEW